MLTLSKQRGFSLIELMVGVVIVGLLFALAAPNFSAWMQNQQIRTAAESILNGIQLARSEAVKNNRKARFVLCNLPDSSWEVVADSPAAPAPAASLACGAASTAIAAEVRVQERSGQEGSRQAQVSATATQIASTAAVTSDGSTTIFFNAFGRVMGTSIATIEVATATGRALRITVGAGGNVRMCDPSTQLSSTDPRHC